MFMNKMKLIALIIGAAGITGMSACRKCKICTKESSLEIRLCEKDYGSKTEYGLAVDALELQNYTCKESI